MKAKILILIIILLLVVFFTFLKKDKEQSDIINNNINENEVESETNMKIYIKVNNTTLNANLINNSSANALIKKLKTQDITITMEDYGNFEKVGNLGFELPRNDEHIKTSPGDIILYQGNMITIYYDENSWNFTKLGKIENITKSQLLDILGSGDVNVTFSLNP